MTNNTVRHTILVVDDDLMNTEMLSVILAADYNVLKAQSGAEALELLATEQPDLLLVDVVMPEMDGFDLCVKIRELPGLEEIPFIFLTCMAEQKDEVRGLALGAADYITKPYNPDLVRLRVRNHLLLKVRLDKLSDDILERKKKEEVISILAAFC